MTKIYLTNSGDDHEDLYDKTNIHFKAKTRKDCLSKKFPSSSSKLSVKVCKTWFESQSTHPVQVCPGSQENDRDRTKFRTNLKEGTFNPTERSQCSRSERQHVPTVWRQAWALTTHQPSIYCTDSTSVVSQLSSVNQQVMD